MSSQYHDKTVYPIYLLEQGNTTSDIGSIITTKTRGLVTQAGCPLCPYAIHIDLQPDLGRPVSVRACRLRRPIPVSQQNPGLVEGQCIEDRLEVGNRPDFCERPVNIGAQTFKNIGKSAARQAKGLEHDGERLALLVGQDAAR